MEQINKYQVIQNLNKFNENLNLWHCENTEGDSVEIFTVCKQEYYQKLFDRLLIGEIKPLENREIEGIQKIIDTGFDNENQCYYIVFENLTSWNKLDIHNATIQGLKNVTKGLDILKKENRQVFYIAPETIFVNSNGNAKLKFVGLFELFKNQNLLVTDYFSSNVKDWLIDSKKSRPNFQDDIFSLIKSFENLFSVNYDINHQVIVEILQKSLAEKRTERFAKYHELIQLLEQIPEIQQKENNKPIIKIATKPVDQANFQDCLNDINQTVWLLVDSILADKGNIKIKFSTQNWSGSFYLNERDNHIFCPFFQNQKEDKLIKDSNSFLANFNFEFNPLRPINCVSYFKQKFEEQNRLSELNKTKTDLVKLWQVLPEKEREYIEETAFKARYCKCEQSQNNSSNIKFELVEGFKNWDKVKQLKNEFTTLFINDQRIGLILDFHPKENFITIKDAFCSIDEIPENGELLEDVRQETSQFKKQVEACKKFEKSDVVNPVLCSILATPETTTIPSNIRFFQDEYDNFREQVFNKHLQNDDTQREAVLEALHYKPVYLIQGPPGTGKTTVIVELVQQILEKQKDVKILITSQSNLAVDNVLERIGKINQSENKDMRFMRLASEQTLEKENITNEILPHTFENKLKNWVTQTIGNSKNYISSRFASQEKQKILIDFYDFYTNLDKEKGFLEFNNRLSKSQNYLKNLFEKAKNLKEVKLIFENNLSQEYLKLKDIQKDWFAYLSGATVDDGKDRKKSMLNDGSTEIDFLTAIGLFKDSEL